MNVGISRSDAILLKTKKHIRNLTMGPLLRNLMIQLET